MTRIVLNPAAVTRLIDNQPEIGLELGKITPGDAWWHPYDQYREARYVGPVPSRKRSA
jgi:hypothetical protein